MLDASTGRRLPEPTYVRVGGAEVATYVLAPEGESRGDVVLCHGTPWSARVWAAVGESLRSDYRVYLWDMPGYGRSTMNPSVPVDLPSQMTRLAELLSSWGLRRPHVVAHDIGGAVALGAHLVHGVDYADLFCWDVVTLDPWGSPFFRLVADHADVFSQLPPALHAALVTEYIAGAARHLGSDVAQALAEPWLEGEGQAAFYRQIASLSPDHTRPLVDRLGQMRCETRIGWGAQDPWIPGSQAYELQSRLPGSPRVVELSGVGHLAPIEATSWVVEALNDWLTRAPVNDERS